MKALHQFARSLMIILALGSIPTSSQAEFREWTSTDGRTLWAEFVRLDQDQVTIKRRTDGKEFTLPLADLSEADREWTKAAAAAQAAEILRKSKEAATDNPYAALITGEWVRHEAHGLKFRLFGDPVVMADALARPEQPRLPLVIDLHGRTGDVMTPEKPWGPANFAQGENFRERPCFILVPQAPPDDETWRGKNGEAVIEIAEDLIKHLPIDEDRVYLTGYSMGAYGTFHLLATEPKFFAAAVPIAGGGNPGAVRDHRKVPVWVFHGALDDVVELSQSERMVEAMERARAPVKFDILPEGDHGISGQVYQNPEVHAWLFQQVRP